MHPFPYPERVVDEWKSVAEGSQKRQRIKHPIHMAFRWQRMLEQDEELTMRRIARREGISSTRVYQVMNFLKMPEDVQAYLRSTRDRREAKYLNEKRLRHLFLDMETEEEKIEAFEEVLASLR